MRFGFIHAEKVHHGIRTMCRVLQVAPSGYYAWIRRGPNKRKLEDERLKARIRAVHSESTGTYGSPRVHEQLKREGFEVSRERIARLLRDMGLMGLPRKRFRCTTDSAHDLRIAPNVLARNFEAERPDACWTTDITYVWTWQGWLYLAVVLDLFSRRVVGWAMQPHLRTELALEALQMALGRRVPDRGLLHHSDRGCQYAADEYQRVLRRHGIWCSMSRRGNCWDNAVTESFFGTLKIELIDRRPWPTLRAAKDAVASYIEGFYNPHRLHSSLGYTSPNEFERKYSQKVTHAA
jgi:putative transposase